MGTQFAISRDGGRIAYETAGSGPCLVLLHGGGQNRRVWRDTGWTEKLANHFQVIALDMRGHGESCKPLTRAEYGIERLCDDILAVADAVGVSAFQLWGYSYGGNIGRYLAARSQRVERFAMIGVSFGPAVDEGFRAMILQMQERWRPVLEAEHAGTLDIGEIPEGERGLWISGQIPVMFAWLGALLEWPSVEPRDMQCATLWIAGTLNASAMRGVEHYRKQLEQTRVRVALVDGLDHAGELERAELMLPALLEFTKKD